METIEDKILKLLALANDSSDEESHTALLMAQKLMIKHDISIRDININEVNVSVTHEILLQGKFPNWVHELAGVIAPNFKCKSYYKTYNHVTEFVYMGLEQDVIIAKGVFLYAYASIRYHSNVFLQRKEIKRKYKRKHELKRDYITGYINGLNYKFQQQVQSEGYELALVMHPVLIEKIDEMNFTKGISRSKEVKDITVYNMGFEDGRTFKKDLQLIE
ncbi:DUF2786 domain-containing protein [Gottfriedia solisilvae]|uniref:DUF2786 domain-containing protein n=1 Tax=Gottfriedia solisilvae TaxID=1516104 RepID=UPI003D2EF2FB